FFSSRRRHTRFSRDWSSDVCSSDLIQVVEIPGLEIRRRQQVVERGSQPAQEVAAIPRILEQETREDARASFAVVQDRAVAVDLRSEERRVGKEWRSEGARGEVVDRS